MIEDEHVDIISSSNLPHLDTLRLRTWKLNSDDNRLTNLGLNKLFKNIDFSNLIDLCLGF